MPMRTNSGRAAIYRRVWGWPLRSMRNAGATLAVVAVLAFIVVQLRALGEPEPSSTVTTSSTTSSPRGGWSTTYTLSTTSGRASTSPTASSAPASSAVPVAPVVTSAPADPTAQALTVIDRFMRAWVNHQGMTGQAWTAQMTDLVQPELLDRLRSVDPAAITSTTVKAAPVVVDASAAVVTADVQTDTDTVRVVALARDGAWRVRSYDKAGA
jgi:hypothetical protein